MKKTTNFLLLIAPLLLTSCSNHNHVESANFAFNESTHWHTCSLCDDYHFNEESHNFIKEVVNPSFLKSEAKCGNQAIYYKSCVCGAKGEEIFYYGAIKNHDYGQTVAVEKEGMIEYQKVCKDCGNVLVIDTHYHESSGIYDFNEENHWFTCPNDNYHLEETRHIFNQEVVDDLYLVSKATCKNKAKYFKSCICGAHNLDTFEFGELANHTFGEIVEIEKEGKKISGRICEECNYVKELGDLKLNIKQITETYYSFNDNCKNYLNTNDSDVSTYSESWSECYFQMGTGLELYFKNIKVNR